MAPFEAKYTPRFIADLARVEPALRNRIIRAIESKLLQDPFRFGRKLVGKKSPGAWRFRVGDYRVRFDIEGRVVVFHRVAHRRDIYE